MKDFIVISGAPGSGKSTIAKLLQKQLGCPRVNLGWIRQWHLKLDWSNASKEEEEMSFETLVFALRNYVKHGYRNVLVEDLEDDKVQKIAEQFADGNYIICSLIVDDDEELKKRVLSERDSGYKNFESAIEWNHKLKKRGLVNKEFRIDNSHNEPSKAVEQILSLVLE